MNNTQLYLSIGIPSFLVILAWLSNRADIQKMGDRIDKVECTLRAEMVKGFDALRAEMHKELDGLRSEMRKELDGMRSELRKELDGMRSNCTKVWMEFAER